MRGNGDEIKDLKECDMGHYLMTHQEYKNAFLALNASMESKEECPKAKWYLVGIV